MGRLEKAASRQEAAGALLGYGVAVGIAIVGAAMAVNDTTAIALGATDPFSWGVSGWIADIVPHVTFGVVAAATLELVDC